MHAWNLHTCVYLFLWFDAALLNNPKNLCAIFQKHFFCSVISPEVFHAISFGIGVMARILKKTRLFPLSTKKKVMDSVGR